MTNEELTERIQQGEADLLPQLWEQVRRFVHQKAYKRAKSKEAEYDDLVQSGYLALTDAASDYDPASGASFIHYFAVHLKKHFNICRAAASGWTIGTYRRARESAGTVGSLNKPLPGIDGENGDAELIDILEDADAQAAFDDCDHALYLRQLRAALNESIDTLPPDIQEVIRRRYYAGEYLHTVADGMGVSRDRARQMEYKGLQKLRKPEIRRRLAPFLYMETAIIESTGFHASGLQRFRETWTSSVELAYERLERMRAERSREPEQ